MREWITSGAGFHPATQKRERSAGMVAMQHRHLSEVDKDLQYAESITENTVGNLDVRILLENKRSPKPDKHREGAHYAFAVS